MQAGKYLGQVKQVCDVLEECKGLNKIEDLQTHENMEVYQVSLDIIDKYFGAEVR